MSLSQSDFWKLLKASGLLSRQWLTKATDSYRQADVGHASKSARDVAQWLVGHRLITQYQASVLLNGKNGPFVFGDYRVYDRVRKGRLAGSYRAIHRPSRHKVMLRFVTGAVAGNPEQWNDYCAFVLEACRSVHHQLQRIYTCVDAFPYRFLVTEPLTGKSAARCLSDSGPFAVSQACRVVRLAALGLQALAEQGQVHGDIRPENVWLTDDGNVRLLRDYVSIPKAPVVDPDHPQSLADLRFDYAAPELAHADTSLTTATDMYALGCTFYQLLAGQPPFEGGDASLKLHRHATEAITPLEQFAVAPAVSEVVTCLMGKNIAARTIHPAELADRLSSFIAESELEPPPPAANKRLAAFEQAIADLHQGIDLPKPLEPPPETEGADVPPPIIDIHGNAPRAQVRPGDVALIGAAEQLKATHRLQRVQQAQRRRAIVLGAWAIGLTIIAAGMVVLNPELRSKLWGGARNEQQSAEHPRPKAPSASPGPTRDANAASRPITRSGDFEVWPDDGQSLWMTPTSGPPLTLELAPPGTQLILAMRLSELVTTTDGKKLLQAGGPALGEGIHWIEQTTGIEAARIHQLILCWRDAPDGAIQPTAVVQLDQRVDRQVLLDAWDHPTVQTDGSVQYLTGRSSAYYLSDEPTVQAFAVGPRDAIQDVASAQGAEPVLRREMTRLLQSSDAQRHISVLFAPSFLWNNLLRDGRTYFFGDARRLREPLQWLLDEELKAGLFSLHVDQGCYLEWRTYGQANHDSVALAQQLRSRVQEVPEQMEDYFQYVYPSAYWRRIALRVPEMARFISDYTRVGVEDGQALVNIALPTVAAHNLVFAAERLLSEQGTGSPKAPRPAAPAGPTSINELLATKMNLSFDQKSLEFAMRDLAVDLQETYPALPFAFGIKILGTDLQLDGITRNQQIASFSAEQQTVADILTALVMRANPVTTVKAASETDQKLVWVVGPNPDDPDKTVILITTRDAVGKKGYTLPTAFQTK